LGQGNNTITTGAGWVGSIQTYSGADTVSIGSGGSDQINVGKGNNTITTTTGWVGSIQTYGGVDTVTVGSGGASQISLGGGNDTLIINTQAFKAGTSGVAGQGSVLAQGGSGTDTADFSAVTKDLTVKLDAGYVESAGLDKLSLTSFEILKGGSGNDLLVGSAYAETISGGLGRDVLTGGAGADKFLFNAMETSANRDTITDFAVAEDKIQFSKSVFTGLTGNAVTAAIFATANGAMTASTQLILRLWREISGPGQTVLAMEYLAINGCLPPAVGATISWPFSPPVVYPPKYSALPSSAMVSPAALSSPLVPTV
jgi:Ca2+-binding RTX toxin-like protein